MIPSTRFISRQITHELSKASTKTFCRQIMTVFRPTMLLNEKITVKVPTMGDSITEGTIVEWAVGVGEAVKEGDVIVLVETDKVTIDIKADFDGVLVEHCGQVDDTVEVGADLYKIDTEGAATVTFDKNDAPTIEISAESKSSDIAASIDVESSSSVFRKPSIQFLGKLGWKEKLSVVAESSPQTSAETSKPNSAVTLDGGRLTPMYGRLPFSEREIEALIMGGATVAPTQKY